MYIKKIEISKTGESWEEILSDDTGPEITIKEANTVKIGQPNELAEGQYHGLRLTIVPKIKFVKITNLTKTEEKDVDVTLEKLPEFIRIETDTSKSVPISETITLSSANGFLNPFDIEGGVTTYLVFDVKTTWKGDTEWDIQNWSLYFQARATRFLE